MLKSEIYSQVKGQVGYRRSDGGRSEGCDGGSNAGLAFKFTRRTISGR